MKNKIKEKTNYNRLPLIVDKKNKERIDAYGKMLDFAKNFFTIIHGRNFQLNVWKKNESIRVEKLIMEFDGFGEQWFLYGKSENGNMEKHSLLNGFDKTIDGVCWQEKMNFYCASYCFSDHLKKCQIIYVKEYKEWQKQYNKSKDKKQKSFCANALKKIQKKIDDNTERIRLEIQKEKEEKESDLKQGEIK